MAQWICLRRYKYTLNRSVHFSSADNSSFLFRKCAKPFNLRVRSYAPMSCGLPNSGATRPTNLLAQYVLVHQYFESTQFVESNMKCCLVERCTRFEVQHSRRMQSPIDQSHRRSFLLRRRRRLWSTVSRSILHRRRTTKYSYDD